MTEVDTERPRWVGADRVLAVLVKPATLPRGCTLDEIAGPLGQNEATVHHALATLGRTRKEGSATARSTGARSAPLAEVHELLKTARRHCYAVDDQGNEHIVNCLALPPSLGPAIEPADAISIRGDLINTGTPPGVGVGSPPPLWLQPADVMELGIDGLGVRPQKILGPR